MHDSETCVSPSIADVDQVRAQQGMKAVDGARNQPCFSWPLRLKAQGSLSLSIYICILYIYIYREREREREMAQGPRAMRLLSRCSSYCLYCVQCFYCCFLQLIAYIAAYCTYCGLIASYCGLLRTLLQMAGKADLLAAQRAAAAAAAAEAVEEQVARAVTHTSSYCVLLRLIAAYCGLL